MCSDQLIFRQTWRQTLFILELDICQCIRAPVCHILYSFIVKFCLTCVMVLLRIFNIGSEFTHEC